MGLEILVVGQRQQHKQAHGPWKAAVLARLDETQGPLADPGVKVKGLWAPAVDVSRKLVAQDDAGGR